MPSEAKRLFIKLKVGEISIVDEPANEKEIIVAKSKEPEMTTEALAAAETPAVEATDTAKAAATAAAVATAVPEVVQSPVDEGTPDEVVDALKGLVTSVMAVATAKAKKASDDDKKPAFLKTGDDKLKAMEEKLKAGGMEGKELKTALAAAKAAFGASGIASTSTKKAAESEPAPAPVTEVDSDEMVMKVLETISKAKTFTPARIKKLVETITNLNDLLDDLGIDKAAFGATGITTTPTAATPSPGLMDNAASGGAGKPGNAITKAVAPGLDADQLAAVIAKALEPVTSAQAELNGRLESIEKARSPSTQPGGGEGDGTEVPIKKNDSIWSGVL